jgi:hypothetical protein
LSLPLSLPHLHREGRATEEPRWKTKNWRIGRSCSSHWWHGCPRQPWYIPSNFLF